ncbi:MAG: TIGR02996 domain-containing protein [Gemmataceae bacterium]
MSDEEALLAAIIANPDEDTPRLVYADWLDENGQPERAEFIRLQIRSANLPDSPEGLIVKQRVMRLCDKYGVTWLEQLGLVRNEGRWVRGFVEHVTVTPEHLVSFLERLFRVTPVSSLEVLPGFVHGGPTALPVLFELAEWPQLSRIRSLRLFRLPIGDQGIRALVESPFISNLQALDLSRSILGDEGVTIIANSPHLKSLRSLCLFDHPLNVNDVLALAQSPYFERIENLNLICTLDDSEPGYEEAVEALTRRFGDRADVSVRD